MYQTIRRHNDNHVWVSFIDPQRAEVELFRFIIVNSMVAEGPASQGAGASAPVILIIPQDTHKILFWI